MKLAEEGGAFGFWGDEGEGVYTPSGWGRARSTPLKITRPHPWSDLQVSMR
jgi:hypothetical protein